MFWSKAAGGRFNHAYRYPTRAAATMASGCDHRPKLLGQDSGYCAGSFRWRADQRQFKRKRPIRVEPVNPQDKVMMGMLASLGIEKGKPFAPDATTKRAMRQAAIDVWFYLQQWFDNFPKEKLYWPDRHYASLYGS